MFAKLQIFFSFGFVWLFIFSVPVGEGKTVFQVAHSAVVDTRPVHWFVEKVQAGLGKAASPFQTSTQSTEPVFPSAQEKLSQQIHKDQKKD